MVIYNIYVLNEYLFISLYLTWLGAFIVSYSVSKSSLEK